MIYNDVLRLGKGIVIPSSHDAPYIFPPSNPELIKLIQEEAQNGYYYEGCGEDNCGAGEGREKSFLQSINAPTNNNGSFDDLDLGYYNGYVLFSNIEANKETLNKLLSIPGDTVKDVIVNAAKQGIATQNNKPVSHIDNFTRLLENNFTEEQLSQESTKENIIQFLKDGENIMWGSYDINTGGPEGSLAEYAKKATHFRRKNLKNKISKGGIAFIGDGHIPEIKIDFPESEVIGTLVDNTKIQEQVYRIKQMMSII